LHRTPQLIVAAAVALAASALPAAAAQLVASVGVRSDFATQTCTPPQGQVSGTSTVGYSAVCARADVGVASGDATAAVGHLGAHADAATINGNSLAAGIGATATYSDLITFTSSDPNATFADVAINLILAGELKAGAPNNGAAGAGIEGFTLFNGQVFSFRYGFFSDGTQSGSSDFFVEGVVGSGADAALRSPTVRVGLGVPVFLEMFLQASAGSSGVFSSALSEFGNSFKMPTGRDVFDVPDGVTANAGDYIVDNRYFDPLTPTTSVPEPQIWALMVMGFALSGALARRRRWAAAFLQ
jgi:hypothetical protein